MFTLQFLGLSFQWYNWHHLALFSRTASIRLLLCA